MLGNVLRTVRGIEVSDESLSVETIAEVVRGPNHYLGQAQTLELMEKDYIYPELSDRTTPDQWKEAGATDIAERARDKVRRVLAEHYPGHVEAATDARIRQAFDIRLDREAMAPGDGRW
jgi:trimethylamine--corrinoid protein Co-methyltransferase